MKSTKQEKSSPKKLGLQTKQKFNSRKNNSFILIGLSLLVLAFWIAISTYFPLLKNEIRYQAVQNNIVISRKIVPLDNDFGIIIPKIEANSKIIRDVDPFNEDIYQKALTKGVAHAKGSSLPGQGGNIFIFSHSSSDFLNARRYNSIFYLLSKLNQDDDIKIYFENIEYKYTVVTRKIVEPTDLSYLSSRSDQEILTLMTCWPPGTSQKRLIIQAKRVAN